MNNLCSRIAIPSQYKGNHKLVRPVFLSNSGLTRNNIHHMVADNVWKRVPMLRQALQRCPDIHMDLGENLLEMATDALFIDQVNGQDAIDGKKLDSSGNAVKAQVRVNFSPVVHSGDHPAFDNFVEAKVISESETKSGRNNPNYWADNSKCNEIKQVLSAVQDELKELLITGNPTSEVLKFADTVPNKGYFKLRNTP